MKRPHILILGAGFGGMYTARKLASLVRHGEADITIINETNYFLFTPLLHEVATGALSPQSVTEPIREIFSKTNITIYQGKVSAIHQDRQVVTVLTDINDSDERVAPQTKHEIPYDILVLATGATTAYYGIPGADTHTYPMKTIADALDIRARVINTFEEAVMSNDPVMRARLLSFAVVGGGPTGVEIVSELNEFIKGIVKRYYSCQPEEAKVSLIHAGTELLQQFSPKLRKAAENRLKKEGVDVHVNMKVTSVTPDGLVFSDGTNLQASTVIWAAGVTPTIPPFVDKAPTLVGNRLAVDSYFRLVDDKKIFVLGDMAGYVDTTKPVNVSPDLVATLPMLAQVAVGQAAVVAANIKAVLRDKKMRAFTYHSKGSLVSIGQWFAIGEIFSLKISGTITWWIWRTVYLFKFFSWKKRVRIVIDWTLNIFYPRDITTK